MIILFGRELGAIEKMPSSLTGLDSVAFLH